MDCAGKINEKCLDHWSLGHDGFARRDVVAVVENMRAEEAKGAVSSTVAK